MRRTWDAIVIGCGAMGSAACASLARRGAQVLGIEQFTRGHDRGSSHGGSRIYRESYFEADDYVPLLRRAGELWEELEEISRERLLHRCGALYLGDPQGEVITGVARSAARHGVTIESLTTDEVTVRFPMFSPPAGSAALWEPRAGFVRPERAVHALLRLAEGHGAQILEGERVLGIKEHGRSVTVETDAGEYEGGSLVLTGGAWTAKLAPTLAPLLRPTRQALAWIDPGAGLDAADASRCPVWFIEDGAKGGFYGVPMASDQAPPRGLKVARHLPGKAADPDVPQEPATDAERRDLEEAMATFLPGVAGPVSATATCLYTMSPDGHFIIDRVPDARRMFMACGFSGHGFKFAPVVGEVLAQLALEGRNPHPIEFLRMARLVRPV